MIGQQFATPNIKSKNTKLERIITFWFMLCVSVTETIRHAGRRRALQKDRVETDKTRLSSMEL